MSKVLAYQKLLPTKKQAVQSPDLKILKQLYAKTHFRSHKRGRHMECLFVRGSTASLLPNYGKLKMRTKMSDVDLVAITGDNSQIKSGYYITHEKLPTDKREVEIDILMINAKDLAKEQHSRYGTFFSTKLIQTSWLVDGATVYQRYRFQALLFLIKRAYSRLDKPTLATPSQFAKWIIDEDLYAEPWRFTSFKTAFVSSPFRDRNRLQLIKDTEVVLQSLYKKGLAFRKSDPKLREDAYLLNLNLPYNPYNISNRTITIAKFIYDQLVLLVRYRNGLTVDNGFRLLLKVRSLLQNPRLRFDSSIIFEKS